ncbi:PRD domain-containing protein [Amphibacillus sp. Q70]|uniref:PRD domain-containing protein n=1 Tax=Amphibacillus sp. Q70 TaxID=3453416 RepID=UPI003F847B00
MDTESSKEKIINYLKDTTNKFNSHIIDKFTTNYIADELHLSRSLVSLYLNDLYKLGYLMKISTRPVYYFNKKVLEYKYQTKFEYEYLSIEKFIEALDASLQGDPYKRIIGSLGSLSSVINQLKTAILYPNGLPILLIGENGTGRKRLAKLSAEFFRKIILQKKETYLYEFNEINIQELEKLDHETEGIVIIEGIHELNDCQEMLVHEFIDQQKDNNNTRIILTALPEGKEYISPNLIIQIPIITSVPSWKDRFKAEKLNILYDLFKKEEIVFEKKIMVSEQIIHHLTEINLPHNISDIKRRVKSISASAYSDNIHEKEIKIYPLHNISKEPVNNIADFKNNTILSLEEIFVKSSDRILSIWNKILDDILNHTSYYEYEYLINYNSAYLNEYSDFLIFEEMYPNEETRIIEQGIQNILSIFTEKYYVKTPINFAYILARVIIIQNQYSYFFQEWEDRNSEQIKILKKYFSESHNKADDYTRYLINQLKINYKGDWFFINELVVYASLIEYNENIKNLKIKAVILCHGYSTASSIADTVNKILQLQVFEAIDVPIDHSIDRVTHNLNDFLRQNNNYESYLFLVDMGSLERIAKDLKTTSMVGIINHVSTPMALHIGDQICKGNNPAKILHEYKENDFLNFHILEKQKKEKAIIFSSDINVDVAKKLSHLFRNSLPQRIPLKILAYNETVQKNHYDLNQFIDQYEVVLLVRPITMKLDNVPNVAIEDIINFTENDMIFNIFKEYLNDEEMEQFREALLINFSMDSLMNKLLILNPHQLLKQVSKAIMHLQYVLKKKLTNRTIIGLNIHICFLVEKLVTKGQATSYPEIENFEKEHANFISSVEKCFYNLIENYNVELPLSEIAYIYEYIKND